GLEIEQMEAALQRDDGARAVLAQRHRADLLRHVPATDFASLRGGAEHPTVETVDPVEPLLLGVPERPFAERGLDVREHFDAHRFLPVSTGSIMHKSESLIPAKAGIQTWPRVLWPSREGQCLFSRRSAAQAG